MSSISQQHYSSSSTMNKQSHQPVDPKIFGKVLVLMGGWSPEREISFMSGNQILESLLKQGIDAHALDVNRDILMQLQAAKPDRVFIALHGSDGESGLIQAILEGLHIPYTGSGHAACALTLDKMRNKWLWQGVGLPVPKYQILTADSDWSAVITQLGLPLFVKPSCEGSSLGITKVKTLEQLMSAYQIAAPYQGIIYAEQFVDGPEYSVPILAGRALPSICIRPANEFYDYEAKYFVETTKYDCPSGLTAADEKYLGELALQAYSIAGCRGWGRVDFMRCRHTGQFYLLEINTAPGMTSHSLMPQGAAVAGIDFEALTLTILQETL